MRKIMGLGLGATALALATSAQMMTMGDIVAMPPRPGEGARHRRMTGSALSDKERAWREKERARNRDAV